MIEIIVKKTKRIRYWIAPLIIKYITPSLYRTILPLINPEWSKVPRPSIMFMKELFNRKKVIGAEIGVQKGINSKSILKELNVKKLYLIDAWLNYEELYTKFLQETNFELILKRFSNNKKVEIIREFSKDAIKFVKDDSLDFVYIDANHAFEFVYQDIKLWYKKVKIGGVVAGHDIYGHPEVLKALKVFCYKNEISFNIKIPDWYFIKSRGVKD